MPDDIEEDYELTAWMGSVELRLKGMRIQIIGTGAVGVVALGLGVMAFKGLTNLAKSLAEVGQATNALMQVTFGTPAEPTVNTKATGPIGSVDETPVTNGPIAEPYVAPGSGEASDEVKGLIANDPISPAELARQDQLRQHKEGL